MSTATPPVMITSLFSGSGIEQPSLSVIIIRQIKTYSVMGCSSSNYLVLYFSLKVGVSEPSNVTFSEVRGLGLPPMRNTPEAVAQEL